jgi:hypothetical protein
MTTAESQLRRQIAVFWNPQLSASLLLHDAD